jgi:hypothetical protein
MCSKLNPEEAEVCGFCSARLKPLRVGEPQPSTPLERSEEEAPAEDWLSRIRADAARAEQAPEPQESPEGGPDWLSRLRKADGGEEGPPEGEVPSWVASGADDLEAAGPPPHEAEPSARPGPEPAEGIPDWLARVRERRAAEEETDRSPAAEEPESDWLGRLREAEPGEMPAADELSGRLAAEGDDRAEADQPAPADRPREPEPAVGRPRREQRPAWLPAPAAREEAGAEESPPLPTTPWEPGQPALSPSADRQARPAEPSGWTPSPETPLPELLSPNWGQPSPRMGADAAQAGDSALPHVPALMSEETAPFVPGQGGDFDLDAIELPDWLEEAKAPAPAARPTQEERSAGLAPATLPAWLEAMRPMETFRPVVEVQPEDEQFVEGAGPLAGLRGVLGAEPIVAMPRQSKVASARLDVTERQYAHAEFLHRMVEEEQRELPPPAEAKRKLPLARWLIAAVLVTAVALPAILGIPSFPIPTLGSPDLNPFITRILSLPADRPVLMVFDYEPGYAGELEAVAGPMLETIVSRGLKIATISTRPSGPPLAEHLLQRIGSPRGYQNGRDYLHLGYLPGGPAAVQLFVENPRQAVPRGYLLPMDLATRSGWDSEMLAGVGEVQDFGAVILITSGAETARVWIEQAAPRLGDVPLLMVLSAGVEPMVRPYYEALNPQVDAILAGLPAAAAYESANTQPGGASAIWSAFGSGLLAVELILALGALIGLATFVFNRGRA